MTKNFTGTAASVLAVAADEYRAVLFIQHTNATQVALGIGTAALAGEGIQLINKNDCVILRGHDARQAIYVIGNGGTCTYESCSEGFDYSPGPYVT